ncbi:MAG TPA: tetratricopeptide repeat protein, partial [Thermoanaerobaculia bacterium]|nr:tetratricopeptide repeat protein [Thermoanaerobaculia bacterium]
MSQKSPQGRFPPPDRRPAIRLRTLAPTALALSLLWAPASLAPAAIGDALPSLAPGLHFAHGLQGGESQRFPVSLDAGQFLRVVVTEEGIDVEVRLLDSEGQPAARVDGPRFPREPEDLAAVAGRPGPYTLEVRSLGVKDPAGRYRLEVDGPRQPTADDRARAEAVRLSQAAVDGMLTPGDESRRRQIALRERALPLWRRLGERRREADTLYQLGTARYRLRQYDEAGCDHHLAIALWRQLDDPSSLGETLREAGLVDRILGRTDEAAHHHTEALTIARRLGSRHLEELALNGLGSSEVDLGEARTAIAPLTEALAIARERRDGVVEASSLINLGAAYDELSEPQRAIPLYGEALTLARRLKDRDDEVTALNDLGTAYEALGDWDRALDDFEQALAMNRRLGDRAQEAATLNNLGLVYQHLERTPEALDAYGQAIARAAETHQPGTEATALDNLGFLHLAGREPEKALAECRQALVLAAGRRETEAAAHQALGRAYRQLGQLAAARAELSQALALSRDRGFRLREADVLRDLAQVARAEGDLPAALAFVRSAAGIVESLRAQVASPDLRASFLGSRRSCYEDYVDVLMALDRAQPGKGYLGEALRVSEQARARSLLEILNEAGADLLRGADPTLLERERRAREEISASALFRLRLLGGPASPEQAAEAARRLEAAVEEHDRIEAELRSASPRYAALTQPEILTLAQVQQGVLDRETLLLEYALGDEHSHLWVVAADAIHGFELPPRAAIEAEARSFYALLTARNDPPPPGESAAAARQRVERADRGLAQAATGLSRTVLPPAAAGLLADRRLVVVSDGALQYIPFGALPCPTDPSTGGAEDVPLVRRHEVVSLPSASVLAVLRR